MKLAAVVRVIFCSAAPLLLAVALSGQQAPLGVRVQPHPDGYGLSITEVTAGSLAARSGLRVGDLAIEGVLDSGEPVDLGEGDFAAFQRLVASPRFTLLVFRQGAGDEPIRILIDRAAAAPPNSAPARTTRGWIRRAVRQHGRPAATTSTGGGTGAAGTPATVVLRKHELRDPGMDNIVSHTLLVPDGWRFDGGVRWTNNPAAYVHFVGTLQSPAGASLNFDYNRHCSYNNNAQVLAQVGQAMGQTLPDGTLMVPPPQRAGEAAERVILANLRPGATAVRLLDAEVMPEAEKPLRDLLAPLLQSIEQQNQMSRTFGAGMQSNTWVRVERARLAYTEGGRAWEEEIHCSMMGFHTSMQNEFMSMESGTWSIFDVRTARAPRGQLEAELPRLVSLARSVRPTPRWSIALQKLQAEISAIQRRGQVARAEIIRQSGQRIARINQEISDMQMDSWRKQQDSQDRIQRATTNTIRGVEDYRATDGTSIAVDNTYDRVFQDGVGNLIMTNDPVYDPRTDASLNTQGWSPLSRIDPFRR